MTPFVCFRMFSTTCLFDLVRFGHPPLSSPPPFHCHCDCSQFPCLFRADVAQVPTSEMRGNLDNTHRAGMREGCVMAFCGLLFRADAAQVPTSEMRGNLDNNPPRCAP